MRHRSRGSIYILLAFLFPGTAGVCLAEEPERGPEIQVNRAAAAISVDGDLSDAGWKGATRVETWYETRPGENVDPKVRSAGYLAYDDRYFYAGFEFSDPDPSRIRAPYSDRDNITSAIDYGGIILDTRNDGRTGILFLATPRGIQYDAVQDDASGGENSSPDFYWDSAGKITPDGWILEIRIPFSSLRYNGAGPRTWGILLFRNYPRENRYQIFSTKLPRGSPCFICHEHPLTSLDGLPSGDHFVVAPYVSSRKQEEPVAELGSPLDDGDLDSTGGLDAKWIPNPDNALDLTLNPDFSQVESDVTRISANERFAIFYPEKRPFFLEGMELYSTSIAAVYTRTLTSPRWGMRATGKKGSTAYTALVGEDRGGGTVIIPGPEFSSFAPQDYSSTFALGRVRRDIGGSYVSFLFTDREIDGGGFNRVAGPDFQWRPNDKDVVNGQILYSMTETPDRPDLWETWDGRELSGFGADFWWSHTTRTFDFSAQTKIFSEEFRADCGYVPQVGFREGYAETGYTWHPKGFLSRVRTFAMVDQIEDHDGALLRRLFGTGVGMDGRWNSFGRFWLYLDQMKAGDEVYPRRQFRFQVTASPSQIVSDLGLEGFVGEEIDIENERPGEGASFTLGGTLRAGDHLAVRLDAERRWLDVRQDSSGPNQRLFTANVERVKAVWTFNSRSFLRLIGQWDSTTRDPLLYGYPVPAKEGAFASSALFSYKLNWQSVLFVGYGDDRALDPEGEMARAGRELFLKVSYAFQR